MINKCSISWCTGVSFAQGVCKSHTNHLYRYGECRRFSNMPNEVRMTSDYAEVVLYKRDLSESGVYVKISAESIPQILGKRFYYSNGYAKLSTSKKTIYLHQILSQCQYPLVCDHINRDRLDCRVENLRCVTRSVNNRNKQHFL